MLCFAQHEGCYWFKGGKINSLPTAFYNKDNSLNMRLATFFLFYRYSRSIYIEEYN
jgi:hypothetical protein